MIKLKSSMLIFALLVFFFELYVAKAEKNDLISPEDFETNEIYQSTVAAVSHNFFNGQPVILVGKITRYLGHEKYCFVDKTGSIDIKLNGNQTLDIDISDKPMKIIGKVDRFLLDVHVDVDSLYLVADPEERLKYL